ncbi:hypothetical protein A2574_00935 [Candidatus Shapirobacteria bacterium RIFOXYD1_FULL_38_32]|uniref:Peptidase, M23 family n=4 Tax=Patescibacteria group TaxID=1783273 RepID=A0A0G0JW15_9BACT|nr:MAG: Peptidase, M23 family [Candidatus Shapirobacteria bacterium GW2011_GWE2_38_30]KKQ91008.1 MAG: Peptidase, M23 family [Candidatus Shapirobacteria bacterium GW2011_GWE1_38_92]OGJ06210.1 MAG: hypothetical protein A2192_02230 [Candidatus Nomurabacteria bacterium RIFOXYA1_FULL_35_17]OGL57146.1 MAG: hypothetical protein A2367_01040 [Candidatus Shapirobacteria bacterium RIFOXYB1_FULL_38_38]OGL57219.1 MAG: hypothetical protein A2574_00935 [Candidatus Shapirobacteria bacterium RIFOXYD1_FULL_38_32
MSKKIFLLSFLILYFIFNPKILPSVNARGADGKCTTDAECQEDIRNAEAMLNKLAKEKDTLSNQIKYINSQVELTRLKISQTENSIRILEIEIADLVVKIDKLDVYLNYLSSILISQINESYKLQKRYPTFMLIFSDKFNKFFEHYKYYEVLQKNNRDSLVNMETARLNYDNQKKEKDLKQQQLAELQSTLDRQNKSLIVQKSSKTSLLEITKNDEVKYQRLKKDAESELATLLAAKFVGKREVKKGEALGIMGNTGYSFGDHLHFGVYELSESNISSWTYANDLDPMPYLNEHGWPMDSPRVTQNWGHTQYSYLYRDGFHHGIDMVSGNKTILSVNDGVAYFYRNAQSSLGNHVKLFHPDGKMTLYLHMQ